VTAAAREVLRARLFLRAVLPLVEVMLERRPSLGWPFLRASARVQLEVRGSDVGAALLLRRGALWVEQGVAPRADVRCRFRDLSSLNAFFSGRPALPRVSGLRHPLLLLGTARLLAALRILHPQQAPAPHERALRVELLLLLVTRALAELHRGGHPEMVDLVARSPERVYQWSVGGGDGAYLRMQDGRIKAGRGTYTRRQPFVHFVFRDVDAALSVLTATGSQMTGLRAGLVQTVGSPEYTRKISLLMQKVDELLQVG
jgi:hypothetical protein